MIRGEEHYDIVLDIEREDIGDAEDDDYDVEYDDGNDNNLLGVNYDLFKSNNEFIPLVLSAFVAAHRVKRGPG